MEQRDCQSAAQAIWAKKRMREERGNLYSATIAGLIGIGPNDELEGMLAAQLVALPQRPFEECYRRAMIGEQTFEGRRETLAKQTSFRGPTATLLKSLNRHRGKGQQKVRLNHVHVTEGGQAHCRHVGGGWMRNKSENQPMQLHMHRPRDAECERGAGSRASRQRWRTVDAECMVALTRSAKGNRNALKHGHYTARSDCTTAGISALIRAAHALSANFPLKVCGLVQRHLTSMEERTSISKKHFCAHA